MCKPLVYKDFEVSVRFGGSDSPFFLTFVCKPSSMHMNRVAAYVRVSTTEQADAYGPDSQREKIRAWAEEDVENVDWYEDVAPDGDTDRDGL